MSAQRTTRDRRNEELRRRHRPKSTVPARDRERDLDLDARGANDEAQLEPEVGRHTLIEAALFGSQRDVEEPVAGKVTRVMQQERDDKRRERAPKGRIAARAQAGRSVEDDRALLEEVLARAMRGGGGSSLTPQVATKMRTALGAASLDHVRIHTGPDAADAARLLGARAFTIGSQIFFGAGEFAPGSDAGDRLLRHELTHVVQHGRGELAGDGGLDIAAESSAVEVEARAAEDGAAPAPHATSAPASESAHGTIAAKLTSSATTDGAAPAAATGSWELHLLNELLKFDLAKAVDAANGEKKLELPRTKVGPIHLQECVVKIDGGKVKSGRLRATLDDGRFKGTAVYLAIDEQSNVTGELNLELNIPGAFLKRIDVFLGPDGLHASVPITGNDFLSKDFTTITSAMVAQLLPSMNLLDLKLEGAAHVKLDEGFANAAGTLTAALDGSKIDASIVANLNVPGLKAVANATLHWDGKNISFEAGASLPFDVPGLKGSAKVTYKDGKLKIESKDLDFTWGKLLGLKLGPLAIDKGKLKAQIQTGAAHTVEIDGAKLTLDAGAHLGLDGSQITGAATGKIALGRDKGVFATGTFSAHAGAAGLDADVTLDQAVMPGVKLKNVKASIKSIGDRNAWEISAGSIDFDIANVLTGSWTNLAWHSSLTGDLKIDFKLPNFKLPSLNLKVLEGWKLHVPDFPEFTFPHIDWSKYLGGFGKLLDGLEGIKIKLKTKQVDLSDLAHFIDSLDFSGLGLQLPKFPQLSIPSLDLKLPRFDLPKLGGGGGAGLTELLNKLSGLMKIKLDFGSLLDAAEVKEHDIRFVDGKPAASGALDLDVHKIFKFLDGKIHVAVDTAGKDPLKISSEGITLANPKLQDWVTVAFKYEGGKLTATAEFKKQSGQLLGFDVALISNQLKFENKHFTGSAKLGASKAGTGSGEVTITYANGDLEVKGHGDVDVGGLTDHYLTGKLTASNETDTTLRGKVEIAKGPLAGMVKEIDASYVRGEGKDGGKLDASFVLSTPLMEKLATAIPGVTFNAKDTPVHVTVANGAVDITGAVDGTYAIPNLMSGTFKAGLNKSVPYGEFTVSALDPKLKLPPGALDFASFLLKLDEHFLPSGGKLDIGFDLKGILKGKLHLDLKNGKIGGFHLETDAAHGFVAKGAQFTLDAGAKFGIENGQLTGAATGKVGLGPGGKIANGTFALHPGPTGLDADITVDKATLPFLKINHLQATCHDVGGANKWELHGGDLGLDVNGIVVGKWTNLSWIESLMGDIKLDFKIPGFEIPSLNLHMLPEWKLRLPEFTELKLPEIDWTKYLGGVGKLLNGLSGIHLGIKWHDVDLTDIGNLIRSLDLSGAGLQLPSFPWLTIPKLDLHFPHFELPKLGGGGGGFTELLKKLSGWLKLKLDFSKLINAAEVKDYDVGFTDGKPSASGTLAIDLGKLFKFLHGTVSVSLDTTSKDPISIKVEGVKLAKPELQEWVEIDFGYTEGKFHGNAKFKKTQGHLLGFDVVAQKMNLGYADKSWNGSATLGAAKAGVGSGEVTITYANGDLEVKGHGDVDVGGLTNQYLTGRLKASNESGTSLSGKVEIAKGPLAGMVKEIDATYVRGEGKDDGKLDASFVLSTPLMAKLKTAIPGVTLDAKDTPIHVTVVKDAVEITGAVDGTYAIPNLMSGTFKAGLNKSVPYGEFTVAALDPKLKLPPGALDFASFLLKLDEHFLPSGGKLDIGVDLKGIIKGKLHLDLKNGKIGGFHLETDAAHGFDLPGAQFKLDAGATFGIDNGQLTGAATGKVGLGPGGKIANGSFALHAGPAGLDADLTVDKATLPFLKVNHLKASIHDVGGAAQKWEIHDGDLGLDVNGIVVGKWTKLGWNGSLTGDLKLDFKIPGFDIPSLNLSMLPEWKLRLPELTELTLPDVDWSKYLGGVGKLLNGLSGIHLGIKWHDVDLTDIGNLIRSLDISGAGLQLPSFPWLTIPKLDLHFPHFELPKLGGGGGFGELLKKLSGWLKLKLDFSKLINAAEVKDYDVGFTDGKPSAAGTLEVDLGKLFKFLHGKLTVSVDTTSKDPISIKVEGVKLAKPELQEWVEIDFGYTEGKFHGKAKFKKVQGSLLGFDVLAQNINFEFKGNDWAGSAKLGAAKPGVGAGEVTIAYKAGDLEVTGHGTVNAARITGGFLTGELSASNEGATTLSGKLNFAKGPLVGLVKDIDATYVAGKDEESSELHAKFSLGKPLIEKVTKAIPGVTITPNDTPIEIHKTKDGVDVTGEISGSYAIPDLMTGTFKAGLKHNDPYGELRVTKLDAKLQLPGATLTLEDFLLLLDQHFLPKNGHYEIGVDVKKLIVGKLHLDVADGKLGGFGFKGAIAETPLTHPIQNLGIKYDHGAWSGEAKIKFKALGNVLDDGATLKLAGSPAGFALSADNVVFKQGVLKGFKIEEVHLSDTGFGGTIGATGVELKVGPVKAHVETGSITFDDKGFVKGDIKGSVDFTDKLKVDFGVKAHGTEVDFEVATGKPIELSTLSPAITGQVHASYKKGEFAFVAEHVHFTNEKVAKLAEIKKLVYQNGHFDIDLHVSAGDLIYAAGKMAKVVPTALKWANGLIDGYIEAHDGNAFIKAGWKHGEFFLGAGGEFNLVEKFPAVFSSGKVKAEGDTSGKAKFGILEPIKLIKIPSMKVTHLSGVLEGPAAAFEMGVEFSDLQNLIKVPGLKLDHLNAGGKFKYDQGEIAVDGHIDGKASVHVGGKEIVSGSFALGYANDEFGGSVTVDKVNLSDKYLKPLGKFLVAYDPKTRMSTALGGLHFHVDNVADGNIQVHPGDVDLKAGKFDFSADVAFSQEALKQFKLHVQLKNGDFKAGVSTTDAKEVNVGGVQLTIGAGSNLAFDSATGQVTGRVLGAARVGKIATGVFDLGFNGHDLDGTIKAKISKMPLFREGFDLDIGIKKGMLSTDKEIVLDLDDKYKKYLDAKVHFKVTNNVVHIGGAIDGINNLGNIGKNTKGTITYDVNTGLVAATGKVPLDGVKFLKDGSTLDLYFDSSLQFGMKGHLLFKDFAGANVKGALDFEWLPGKFFIKGGVDAELKGVAELKLTASSEKKAKDGDLETSDDGGVKFNLAGKITADGLQKRFKGLKFSEPPAVSFWASGDGGAIEYGMDELNTKIVHLPGAGACDVGLQASYVKDKGFNAAVQIHQLKFGFMKASGGLSIKESKFEEANLELESDLKAVNLKGGIKVHAGEMDKLNGEAELKVVPGEGPSLKWLKEGQAKVTFKDGALATAAGKVILAKPPLLPIEQVEINIFKDGDHIKGTLDTEFKVPMAAEGKKGKLHAEVGGDKGWAVHLEADIAPPGFQNVNIKGDADGNGDFGVAAAVVPKNNKYVKGGSIAVGYKESEGGFYMGGTVTLAITDDLEGTVGVKYNAGKEDFEFLGEIKPKQKPPDKTKKELGGFKKRIQIPLFSVGVASAGITMKFELESYMVMPYIQFDHLKLSGSLKQLEAGQLPEIDVGIKFGMGAGVSITVGVGISGKVELLVVTAEGGFRGDFTGSADLMIGAAMNGKFGGDRDGLEIAVDPTVSADVNLSAALVAFAYASCFGFTIIDEEWKLAEFNLATFKLGTWKPIDPFSFVIGGSNPGFKDGLPSFKKEMPSGLEDGAAKGGEDPEGPERERKKEEAKRKVRIVLAEVKRAGAVLDQLPKNWQNGLSLDDMTECDNLLDLGDALDFYRNEADNAEELVPDMKVITTGEKLAKRFADNWFAGALRNYQILNWRRAQIASMGIDPDTGVNVVAEREWVKTVQDQRYQDALDAAITEQTRLLEAWAKDVARQITDYAKAEAAHEALVAKTRGDYEAAMAATEHEGTAAKVKYEQEKAAADEEGVHVPDLGVAVMIPPPQPIAADLPPLTAPQPPPLPKLPTMPIKPEDPPSVHVPALPTVGDIGMSVTSVRPTKAAPPIPEPTPKASDASSRPVPSSEAAAAAGKSTAVSTGGGGGGGRGGGGAPPAAAPKPKGKGDPATITDIGANLTAQARGFEATMAALGAGAAPGAGGKGPKAGAPAAAAAAGPAAAGAVAGGPAAAGGPAPAAGGPPPAGDKDGKDGKADAAGGEGADLHPSVKAAVLAAQKAEDKLKADAAKSEAAYKATIEHEKGDATAETARLKTARRKAEQRHQEEEAEAKAKADAEAKTKADEEAKAQEEAKAKAEEEGEESESSESDGEERPRKD